MDVLLKTDITCLWLSGSTGYVIEVGITCLWLSGSTGYVIEVVVDVVLAAQQYIGFEFTKHSSSG